MEFPVEPLLGANVYITAMNRGAATDANGKYSILLIYGFYTIVCSFVGYEKVEKQIDLKSGTSPWIFLLKSINLF